jgi:ABC-type oligopeptide transport system substrate-binding subunit
MKKWLVTAVVTLLLLSMVAGCTPSGGEDEMPRISFLAGDSETAKKYAMGLQEIIRQNLGIELVLENVDFNTRLEKMRNGDFGIVLAGWGADFDDPINFLEMWETGSPYNDVNWSNEEFDSLINQARAAKTRKERLECLSQAEKILLEELPIIPIYWPQRNIAEHPWVKNVDRPSMGPDYEWKWAYTEGRPGGDDPQYLNVNLGEEPPDLQTLTSTDQISFRVMNAVLEGLTRRALDGAYAQGSGLAESWTVSEDGTVYTFKLRPGLVWSDGTPLTAKDFEYAWKMAVDPRTASQYNYLFFIIKGAADVADITVPDAEADKAAYDEAIADIEAAKEAMGVKAIDDTTLEVVLEAPTSYFINLTAFPSFFPVSQAAKERWGEEYATELDKMLYCGPFTITTWDHGSKMVLTKNESYWDASSVKLQKINMDMIKDINTPVTMYEAGELDHIAVPGDFIPKFQQERPEEFSQLAEATAWYLECNLEHPVLKDVRFRKALSMALDRQAYCDNVLANYSAPATGLVPPSMTGLPGELYHELYVGDILPTTAQPDEAKALAQEALEALGYTMPTK